MTFVWRRARLVAAVTLTGIAPLRAQTLAQVEARLASGDTSGAITGYEALIRRRPVDSELRYYLAMLYVSRMDIDSRSNQDRGKAERHLREAAKIAPDSAKYLITLAEVRRSRTDLLSRLEVPDLVAKALIAASASGGATLARVYYRMARIEWEKYESLTQRHLYTRTGLRSDPFDIDLPWEEVEYFVARNVIPDPREPDEDHLALAERRARESLANDSGSLDAGGLLVIALGESARWDSALTTIANLARVHPDSGRVWALQGLALTRLDRWGEARTTFKRALSLMNAQDRAPYDNLGVILARADSITFVKGTPAQRTLADSFHWAARRPLILSGAVDGQTEFYARITYALHRWSDPLRRYLGVEADQGAVYVRYGPPDYVVNLSPGGPPEPLTRVPRSGPLGTGRPDPLLGLGIGMDDPSRGMAYLSNQIMWLYRPARLRFMFSLTPLFARSRFSTDFRELYRETRGVDPLRFDNIRLVHELDTIVSQVAQFAGDSARTDVVVFAQSPIRRLVLGARQGMLPVTTAVFVKDREWRDIVGDRHDDTVEANAVTAIELRRWRFGLRPDDYTLRLEAFAPVTDRAARAIAPLPVRSFDGNALLLSDLLVASQVVPRDSAASRWTDFFINPSVGRLLPGEPVGLLWEVYNLSPDSSGIVRYRVDVRFTIQRIERSGLVARILGGVGDAVGLSARGNNQVTLSFARQLAMRTGAPQVEYLTVELVDAPQATYAVSITIVDERTGKTATATRNISVTRIGVSR